jgi:toxin ParE1/3/4
MKIVWRARARADMHELVEFIARDRPKAAFRVHDQITHMIGFLEDWPDLGRTGRRAGLRELVVPSTPYLVLYQHEDDEITILRVLHGRRNR